MNKLQIYHSGEETNIPRELPNYIKLCLENWENIFLSERRFISYSSFREGHTVLVEAIEGNDVVAWASGFSMWDRNEAIVNAFLSLYFSLEL